MQVLRVQSDGPKVAAGDFAGQAKFAPGMRLS
jgi:hypothetical protein